MDREKKLIDIAPRLYSFHCWVDCGRGWDCILEDLSRRLERVIYKGIQDGIWDDEDHPCCTKITEALGQLRFHMYLTSEEIDKLIDEAEAESLSTCETCGCHGEMRFMFGSYQVRCEICLNKCKENV